MYMTNIVFFTAIICLYFLVTFLRNEIRFLQREVNKLKDDIVRLEEMMSAPNALKQSESIDSKKKWESLRQAFSSPPIDKENSSVRFRP